MARYYPVELDMQEVKPKHGAFSLKEIACYVGWCVHIAPLDDKRIAIVSHQELVQDQNFSISVGEANEIMQCIVRNMYDKLEQLNGPVLICSPQEYGVEV